MTFVFAGRFSEDMERRSVGFYQSLSEKDRRRFAAIEAPRLDYGGVKYIAELFGCSERTIERAALELEDLPSDPAAGRIRRTGAGRKEKIEPESPVERNLKSVLDVHTAGDPDEDDVVWTNLSPDKLAQTVTGMGTPISAEPVRNWMKEMKLRRRKITKVLAGGYTPNRDAQFEHIAETMTKYIEAGNPVFSIDSKAKERLGMLYRAGRAWTTQAFRAFDHDFPSWADGVIIPHGIYDLVRNRGHINIGLSRDTSLFACDSFRWYWNRIGKQCYPHATSILWLWDGGGSNGARTHIFKQDLQSLVNQIGVEVRIAHYPSYCSKYNPIERRFFPHISRACRGVLFDTLETVVALMLKASTKTGLRATVNVIRRVYETGRKATEEFKQDIPIIFDDILRRWNYLAVPSNPDTN